MKRSGCEMNTQQQHQRPKRTAAGIQSIDDAHKTKDREQSLREMTYLALLVDCFESGRFADEVDTFSAQEQKKTNEAESKAQKCNSSYLAICERVSKSRLFIDVLTSRHPIYCVK